MGIEKCHQPVFLVLFCVFNWSLPLAVKWTNLKAQASATTGSSIKHCRMGQQYFLSSSSDFLRQGSWGIPDVEDRGTRAKVIKNNEAG